MVGVIGAGGYAKSTLLPALARTSARIAYVADLNPVAAQDTARKFKAGIATTDYRAMLDDPDVHAVFILVGHHLHARFVCEALEAGKHVFVEKPLALNTAELERVGQAAAKASEKLLMVESSRRFTSHTIAIKKLLAGRSEPLCMSITINGWTIPADQWIQDHERGGGCHFIDLLVHLAGSPVRTLSATMVGELRPSERTKPRSPGFLPTVRLGW